MSRNGEEEVVDRMEDEDGEVDKKSVVRIMITSDNHLGLKQFDRILREDSFVTFEEILKYAKSEKVDFMLTGGDLFHNNKPSRETFYRATTLMRKYCLGSEPVAIKIHSNQKTNFISGFGHANYLDPNYNISLPVFSIHGNHDDPTGEESLSALDLLAVNGLVNYFGRTDLDPILVQPVLLSKGNTKIALYGIGYIRDQRLFRAFQQKKVHFYRPQNDPDGWFNILVLHQNRHQVHTAKANIKEEWIPNFFSLVIWGHEHEQLIKPTSSPGGFHVIQPGSTVANTFVQEEAKEKKCGVLEIYKKGYRFTAKTLYSVRPLVHDTLVLKDVVDEREKGDTEVIKEFVTEKVEEMIKQAKGLQKTEGHKKYIEEYTSLKLPLIRLRVDYSDGYGSLNPQRFGQQFVDDVANPQDMVMFFRKKKSSGKKKKKKKKPGDSGTSAAEEEALETAEGIENFISKQLVEEGVDLQVLPQPTMWEAVRSFVNKEENKAIKNAVKRAVDNAQRTVWKKAKKKTQVDNRNNNEEEGENEDEDAVNSTLLDQREVEDLLQTYQEDVVENEDFDEVEGKALEAVIKNEKGDDDEEKEEADTLPPSPPRSGQESEEEGGRGGKRKRGRGRKKAASTRKKTTRKRKTPTRRKTPKKSTRKKKKKTPKKKGGRKLDLVSSGASGAEEDDDFLVNDDEEEEDFPNTPQVDDDFRLGDGDVDDDKPMIVDDVEEEPLTPPIAASRPRRSGRKRKRADVVIAIDDDEDEEEFTQPKRKKRKIEEDEDGEDKKEKKKKKKKPKKKKKKKKKTTFLRLSSSDEDKDDNEENVNSQVSSRSRRYRKK